MAKGTNGGSMDVDVSGDQRTVEVMMDGLLRAFEPNAITFNLLQDRVYPILEERARERFANEGGTEVGGAWAALKPYTVEMRGSAHPINVNTGQMKSHILQREPDAIPNTLGGTLWFPKRGGSGKAIEKVKVAQSGLGSPKTVPRPVLGVDHRDMELILIAVGLHIAQNQTGVAGGGMF